MDEPIDALPRTDVDLETELESLREFVTRGGPVMMNHRMWLDVDEFEGRVDQIVGNLPKEIRRAKRICKEEQRLLQDAKDEARRLLDEARAEAEQILTGAREEAERLVEASAIRQRALEQSEATLAHAEETARQIREQSFAYAQEVIGNVVSSLNRLTESVERDRTQLEQNPPDAH